MKQLETMDAHEVAAAYAVGTLSPVRVVEEILDRIERVNDIVNAFCLVDSQAALADARHPTSDGKPERSYRGGTASLRPLRIC